MGGGESPTNLSEVALADLAGVPVAFVRRAVELQLLRPGDGETPFRAADLSRVRLVLACDRAGLPLDAIAKAVGEGLLCPAFMDLPQYRFARFTGLTEEQGDQAAAELAASLAGVVQGVSLLHGGRAVKWLGDEVMFFFPDPGEGVRSALEMVNQTSAAGLPPAHVGLHAGPLVQRDGDYFGLWRATAH